MQRGCLLSPSFAPATRSSSAASGVLGAAAGIGLSGLGRCGLEEVSDVFVALFFSQYWQFSDLRHLASVSPLLLLKLGRNSVHLLLKFSSVLRAVDALLCNMILTATVSSGDCCYLWEGAKRQALRRWGEAARLHGFVFGLAIVAARTQLSHFYIWSLPHWLGSASIVCADHSVRSVQGYREHAL